MGQEMKWTEFDENKYEFCKFKLYKKLNKEKFIWWNFHTSSSKFMRIFFTFLYNGIGMNIIKYLNMLLVRNKFKNCLNMKPQWNDGLKELSSNCIFIPHPIGCVLG